MLSLPSLRARPPAGLAPPWAGLKAFVFLVLATAAAMVLMARVDYAWTLDLARHKAQWLADIMGRTLFEGDLPGGGDGPVIFIIVCAILYLFAWLRPRSARLARLRPCLGFVVCTAFINSVLLVHGLKLALGRARPGLVLHSGVPYSSFLTFGPLYITGGYPRGSFPSGHTALVFILMTLTYIVALDPRRSRRARLAGAAWGGLALAYAVLMAVSRSMTLSHWISDGIIGILLCWMSMHVIYFRVLRIPDQMAAACDGRTVRMPLLPELRLCLWLWWAVLGLVAAVLGARALAVQQPEPWLALLIVPGLLLFCFGAVRAARVCRRMHAALAPVPPAPPRPGQPARFCAAPNGGHPGGGDAAQ